MLDGFCCKQSSLIWFLYRIGVISCTYIEFSSVEQTETLIILRQKLEKLHLSHCITTKIFVNGFQFNYQNTQFLFAVLLLHRRVRLVHRGGPPTHFRRRPSFLGRRIASRDRRRASGNRLRSTLQRGGRNQYAVRRHVLPKEILLH